MIRLDFKVLFWLWKVGILVIRLYSCSYVGGRSGGSEKWLDLRYIFEDRELIEFVD